MAATAPCTNTAVVGRETTVVEARHHHSPWSARGTTKGHKHNVAVAMKVVDDARVVVGGAIVAVVVVTVVLT